MHDFTQRYSRWDNTFLHIIGLAILCTGLSMLIPLVTSFVNGEVTSIFTYPVLISLAVGLPLTLLFGTTQSVRSVDGVLLITIAWWIVVSIGTVPYLLSGMSALDAFFETMSGFTTTGATIVEDIESLPYGLLMWRSMTQWWGGIAIVIIFISILPIFGFGGRSLFHNELHGSGGSNFVTKIQDAIKSFGIIYVLLTLALIFICLILGVNLFESMCIAFATISTGGFMPLDSSISGYGEFIKLAILIFMFLGGTNFYLHYKFLHNKDIRTYFRSSEFKIMIVWFLLITFIVWFSSFGLEGNAFQNFYDSLFTVVSMGTSTGFVVVDYEVWPYTSIIMLAIVMIIGASAGSTANGVKISRIMVVLSYIHANVMKFVHPAAVFDVKLDNVPVSEAEYSHSVAIILLFLMTIPLASFIFMLIGLDPYESVSVSIATIMNVGPALGSFGPMDSYAMLPEAAKVLSIFLMWIGRLEIIVVLVLVSRNFWSQFLGGINSKDNQNRRAKVINKYRR